MIRRNRTQPVSTFQVETRTTAARENNQTPQALPRSNPMKRANGPVLLAFVGFVWLWAAGCSGANDATPMPRAVARSGLQEVHPPVGLADGVYPVAPTDGAPPTDEPGIEAVELVNVPVDGGGDTTPEKIRVMSRPLLRLRDVSHFDFKFENNECTEIAFRNSDELKAYTRDHVGSRLAIVMDNRVISHHKIREAIEADQVRITCCTTGGGDHLHKHLTELKLTSASANPPNRSRPDADGVNR